MSDRTTFPHEYPMEFDTELAAVWYAANYFYEESYIRTGETTGVIFRKPTRKYGFTYRMDGSFFRGRVRWEDVPQDRFVITAGWHTHVPGSRFCQLDDSRAAIPCLLFSLTDTFLHEFRGFSGDDTGLADDASRITHRSISFYLITADMIKRYTPGRKEKMWRKDVPSKMVGMWHETF